jgi:hypothetical protein
MYGAHIWHIPGSTIHASLRRTAHVRHHSSTPVSSGATHQRKTRTEYLEEDIQLIRKYFPGAKTVTLRTPFDLAIGTEDPWKLRTDDCGDPTATGQCGDLAWSH